MRKLLEQLLDQLRAGRPAAVCQLIETRGSTPQKAGAMMLVFADGSQAGTLGGGCVENEVRQIALRQLAQGRPSIDRFDLDYDDAWHNGLICGGRMRVHVDPLSADAGDDVAYYQRLLELVASPDGLTQAIVLDSQRSELTEASMYLFDAQGQPCAWRCPGGTARASDAASAVHVARVAERLRPIAERPRPYIEAGVSYLPLAPRCRLVIVGGGHVGQAVAELAARVDFDIWVLDDREEFVSADRFPDAEVRRSGPIDELLSSVEVTPQTYILVVTRGHHHDQRALYYLIGRGAKYVGLIGSRRKIRMIRDDLIQQGVAAELFNDLYAPVGIDIGSQTVPEIAVSIVAELIAHRNLRGEVPGRPPQAVLGNELHA